MTKPEYEQKKRERWEEFCGSDTLYDVEPAFNFAFDRAYTLGKEKETISQEEIEKEAEKYAKKLNWSAEARRNVCQSDFSKTFRDGANFALGKQEKDIDTVIQGWVARDEVAIRPALYTSKPLRQKKGFKNGYWSYGMQIGLSLDPELFPDLTWDDDPIEVELTVKRKKK